MSTILVAREVSVFVSGADEFLRKFFSHMGLMPVGDGFRNPEGQYRILLYHCPVLRTGEFSRASRECGAFATGCARAIPD